MANYNDIKQNIAENLPDNGKGEITAARLRSTLNEFVDKVEKTETEINENIPLVIDDVAFGTDVDALSCKQGITIAAVAGVSDAEERGAYLYEPTNIVNGGYVDENGEIVQLDGYSYFEYRGEPMGKWNNTTWLTFPAYDGNDVYTPDGNILGAAFYDKDDNMICSYTYDISSHPNRCQMEQLAPYGAVTLRGSLINGTFNPNRLYLFESVYKSNSSRLSDLYRSTYMYNLCPTHYVAALDAKTGRPKIGEHELTEIYLRANDELEVNILSSDTDALLVVNRGGGIANSGNKVIYGPGPKGYRYYKANEDCYVLISGGTTFRIIHKDMFDNDLQYQLATLAKIIRPFHGEVLLDIEGKGAYVPLTYGNSLVVKIPIAADTVSEWVLNTDGIFTLGNVAYWYFGVPIKNADAVNLVYYDNETHIISIDHSGVYISGYALVTLQYTGSGSLTNSIIESTYLKK